MRIVPTLPRLALVVWLACLGLLGLMVGMVVFRIAHPHFLPGTLLLGIEVSAGLALLAGSTWRLIRGRDRIRALQVLLLGLTPLFFLAGYFVYGLNAGLTRHFDINWPIKFLMPLAESLMDLQARFMYPVRTEGAKVVMISTPFPGTKAKVEAMDRHVLEIEARLGGKPTTWRPHWVRGPLLGMDSKAVFGMCMASIPEHDATGADELTHLDQHEVAHVAMTSLCPVTINPPALLLEGWAEANSGIDPTDLAIRAWKARYSGTYHSIAELSGPKWYGRHEWPVYLFGGPLSNFLLDTYGPERYLELYIESRPVTFPDDCRRILGLTLGQLETSYWADIEQKVAKAGDLGMRQLTRMKLGPKIDPVAWKTFLQQYVEESRRLFAPYEHVWLEGEHHIIRGSNDHLLRKTEYQRSGPFASLRFKYKDTESVSIANPSRSLEVARRLTNSQWEMGISQEVDSNHQYVMILENINRNEFFTRTGRLLFDLAEASTGQGDAGGLVVTAIERETEDDRPVVRIVLENLAKSNASISLYQFLFAADDHLAPLIFDREYFDGHSSSTTFEYDRHEGLPVLREETISRPLADGTIERDVLTVLNRKFGPIPQANFEPDRLIDGPIVNVPIREPLNVDEKTWARWYWVLLVVAGLSLMGGVGTTRIVCRGVLSSSVGSRATP